MCYIFSILTSTRRYNIISLVIGDGNGMIRVAIVEDDKGASDLLLAYLKKYETESGGGLFSKRLHMTMQLLFW